MVVTFLTRLFMFENCYQCEICKSVLRTEESYKQHYRRHFTRYDCRECKKRYKTLHAVLDHHNKEHGGSEIRFECDLCDFTSCSNRRYRYHRKTHELKIECKICHKVFSTISVLRQHIRNTHEKKKRTYACNECGETFPKPTGVYHHKQNAHKRDVFYCDKCDIYFKTKATLATHFKQSSNHITAEDMKFICSTCGKGFFKKSLLEVHITYDHLNIIKHKCDLCSKTYKSAANLKRHKKLTHEKVRLPKNKICDHCGAGFTTQAILRTHIRTHTGERPLRCEHCAADFAHPGALYTHKRLVHKLDEKT
ncbi:oocyte zinc finger protein XlCOF6-like isoform X4 [Leptidea sinapis]|uniref:oocyte zinc finger protein XlCOF6-like isoform X4 n=1 Tax=Leptidea sinapis TaxID=189913 RepID=UPI0021C385A0|nr:oocyte zinc finger protein XlCOF6-like isoform X4 [Leptidea sinapis]